MCGGKLKKKKKVSSHCDCVSAHIMNITIGTVLQQETPM